MKSTAIFNDLYLMYFRSILLYLPILGLTDPEIDYTGNGLDYSLNNTPSQANHAPVQSMFGFGRGFQGTAGAAVVVTVPEFMAARQISGIEPVKIPTAVVGY